MDIVIRSVDMPQETQDQVKLISEQLLEQYTEPKDIASFIKKQMDSQFGHSWHCIVGKKFGSYVTHEIGGFIYYYIDDLAFLVFKTP